MTKNWVTIVDFEKALSQSPERLRHSCGYTVELTSGGEPSITVTSLFAEARVLVEGRGYLLCAPLRPDSFAAVEPALEIHRRLRSRRLLPECRVLCDELSYIDSQGAECSCDLLLQRMPEGETLDCAVTHVDTGTLLAALGELTSLYVGLGIRHRNLKPSNLIFGDDGRLHAVRCIYLVNEPDPTAIAGEFAAVESCIRSHPEISGSCLPPVPEPLLRKFDEVQPLHDMMRLVCRDGLFGYVDAAGETVIEPRFTYAENFFENRAVVEVERGRMGVIDRSGRFVVEPVFDMVSMTGEGDFRVRQGSRTGCFDYCGRETAPLHEETFLKQ